MNRLLLFNPENDIALASGLPRITPPRQAAMLHKAGAMLPFWLGDEGDYILVGKGMADKANEWRRGIGVDGPVAVESADGLQLEGLMPWGWSLDAIDQFRRAGVDEALLSHLEPLMEGHRLLSHRRTSLALLRILNENGADAGDVLPEEITNIPKLERFLNRHGELFIKSPWSSSGRGVFPLNLSTLRASAGRIEGIIRKQGSVMAEAALDKTVDFAMLFNYDRSAVFAGYSLFNTTTQTNYGGNIVAPDDVLLQHISRYVDRETVISVRDAVTSALAEIIGDSYSGPLGVDMMVYTDRNGLRRIAPCVEINLRHTMGFVARGVWRRINREGVMSVAPSDISGNLRAANDLSANPISLTPPDPCFSFQFRATPV